MIAKLKGLLDETGADWAVIDVGGRGLSRPLFVRTLAALGGVGEGLHRLCRSAGWRERHAPAGLCRSGGARLVPPAHAGAGVGSKVALAILSALSTGEVQAACSNGDAAMIARANGVGPKLAGRIVNELKDKAGALPGGGDMGVGVAVAAAGGASADAVSALENLGFKPAVAARGGGSTRRTGRECG